MSQDVHGPIVSLQELQSGNLGRTSATDLALEPEKNISDRDWRSFSMQPRLMSQRTRQRIGAAITTKLCMICNMSRLDLYFSTQ
jgi:hypothetical protein